MRETELWQRMTSHLGDGYVRTWAHEQVLADLGGRTVEEALHAGLPCKRIWCAVWTALELEPRDR